MISSMSKSTLFLAFKGCKREEKRSNQFRLSKYIPDKRREKGDRKQLQRQQPVQPVQASLRRRLSKKPEQEYVGRSQTTET